MHQGHSAALRHDDLQWKGRRVWHHRSLQLLVPAIWLALSCTPHHSVRTHARNQSRLSHCIIFGHRATPMVIVPLSHLGKGTTSLEDRHPCGCCRRGENVTHSHIVRLAWTTTHTGEPNEARRCLSCARSGQGVRRQTSYRNAVDTVRVKRAPSPWPPLSYQRRKDSRACLASCAPATYPRLLQAHSASTPANKLAWLRPV